MKSFFDIILENLFFLIALPVGLFLLAGICWLITKINSTPRKSKYICKCSNPDCFWIGEWRELEKKFDGRTWVEAKPAKYKYTSYVVSTPVSLKDEHGTEYKGSIDNRECDAEEISPAVEAHWEDDYTHLCPICGSGKYSFVKRKTLKKEKLN